MGKLVISPLLLAIVLLFSTTDFVGLSISYTEFWSLFIVVFSSFIGAILIEKTELSKMFKYIIYVVFAMILANNIYNPVTKGGLLGIYLPIVIDLVIISAIGACYLLIIEKLEEVKGLSVINLFAMICATSIMSLFIGAGHGISFIGIVTAGILYILCFYCSEKTRYKFDRLAFMPFAIVSLWLNFKILSYNSQLTVIILNMYIIVEILIVIAKNVFTFGIVKNKKLAVISAYENGMKASSINGLVTICLAILILLSFLSIGNPVLSLILAFGVSGALCFYFISKSLMGQGRLNNIAPQEVVIHNVATVPTAPIQETVTQEVVTQQVVEEKPEIDEVLVKSTDSEEPIESTAEHKNKEI